MKEETEPSELHPKTSPKSINFKCGRLRRTCFGEMRLQDTLLMFNQFLQTGGGGENTFLMCKTCQEVVPRWHCSRLLAFWHDTHACDDRQWRDSIEPWCEGKSTVLPYLNCYVRIAVDLSLICVHGMTSGSLWYCFEKKCLIVRQSERVIMLRPWSSEGFVLKRRLNSNYGNLPSKSSVVFITVL